MKKRDKIGTLFLKQLRLIFWTEFKLQSKYK